MKEIVSMVKLIRAYEDCRKSKLGSIEYQHFAIDAEYELYKLYIELNKNTYKPSSSIAFLVHHPKDREVFAANFRDRIVQHLLINEIIDGFETEVIDDSYSCRKGKGTLYGINQCYSKILECSDNFKKKTYIGKFDIQSFFTSIDKDELWKCLETFLEKYYSKDEEQLEFLKRLTWLVIYDEPQKHCIFKTNFADWKCLPSNKSLFYCGENKGLPIGNLTSQIFANLFLDLLDKYVKNELGIKYYGRYVDDFFIISNNKNEIMCCVKKIADFLSSIHLKLHPNKIYIQEVCKGLEFLGVVIKPNRKYVKGLTKGHFFKRIKKFEEYLEYHKTKPIDIYDLKYILTVINSFLGYFRRCNSYKLRKKMLNERYTPNIRKFFTINEEYTKIELIDEYNQIIRNTGKIKEKYQIVKIYV